MVVVGCCGCGRGGVRGRGCDPVFDYVNHNGHSRYSGRGRGRDRGRKSDRCPDRFRCLFWWFWES